MPDRIEALIKYHDPDLLEVSSVNPSEWIDLRSAEDLTLKAGEYKLISLGITVRMPQGYEGIIAARSSTFQQFGLIMVSGVGIVDNAYGRDESDILRFPALAMRNTTIHKNDRICQMRFQKVQPDVQLLTVTSIKGRARGGIGSTGKD